MSTEMNKALVERFDAIFGDPAIPAAARSGYSRSQVP
jgi:hypothetical protein